MHRSIGYFLVCILLIGIGTGCKKTTSSAPATSSLADLVGSWNWVLTYNNGISSGNFIGNPFGDSSTPANTGISQTLTFNAAGIWLLIQNNSLFNQGVFKIDSLSTPGGLIGFLDLVPTGGTDSILNHTISHDTLILSNPHIVGVGRNWVYVRTSSVP